MTGENRLWTMGIFNCRYILNAMLTLVSVMVFWGGEVMGQVVSTNGGSGLAPTYTSLANAITDLNTKIPLTGSVTITLNPGNPETSPLGGYSITAQGTSGFTIIIDGSNNTITAPPQALGSLNDAIFKIIGGDYITLQNFTMIENPANTFVPPGSTIANNTMTEWGVALFYATATNGAKNNTIQNNTISLSSDYPNSVAVYSSVMHAPATPLIQADITNITGSNSNNKVYNNTISNVACPVIFVGSNTEAYMDSGNDIGGSLPGTGNTMTAWGNNTGYTVAYPFNNLSFFTVTPTTFGIICTNQLGLNIGYNNLTSNALATGIALRGIFVFYNGVSLAGTFTHAITNNTVTLSNSYSSGIYEGISEYNLSNKIATNATINITNNTLLNCIVGGSFYGIYNNSAPGWLNMNSNVIRGTVSTNTSFDNHFIRNNGTVVNAIHIDNNQLGVDNAGGSLVVYTNAISSSNYITPIMNNSSGASCTLSITGNNIQGIKFLVPSPTKIYLIFTKDPADSSQNISNNTFTNLNLNLSGTINFIRNEGITRTTQTVSNNSIVGTFTTSASYCYLYYSISDIPAAITHSFNNFSKITLTGAGRMYGWFATGASSTSKKFSNNTFKNWSLASGLFATAMEINSGTNVVANNIIDSISCLGTIMGIKISATGTDTIKSNTISGLAGSSGNWVFGIVDTTASATAITISKNKIYNLSNSNLNGRVYGIYINGGAARPYTIYNNYIGDLRTPNSQQKKGIIGLYFNAGTINAYYNTVWLNNRYTTPMPDGGACAVYANTAASLDLRNNIFFNTSARGVNGYNIAYWRSSTNSTTYASTSNNNLFYAGIPTPTNLIYWDGTSPSTNLLSYQSIVGPRDDASITENPHFISTTGSSRWFLHIDTTCFDPPSAIESGAMPITGITDDYDGDIRGGVSQANYIGIGSAPDIGADEFNSQSVVVTATSNVLGPVSYTTLGGAFAKINDGTHKGIITIKLYCNTVEKATAVLNASGYGGVSYTSVLIYPMVAGKSISRSLSLLGTSDLIDLNGARNVTIDGRVNRTGAADLRIIHTGTVDSSRNIIFRNSAQNNTIKYCKISGSCAGKGMVYFSTSSSGSGNDNNTIDHCELTNSGNRPVNVILSDATGSSGDNSNNTITSNNFYNFLNPGTASNGIYLSANSSAWSITGNSFYENTIFADTAAVDYSAIRISNTSGTNFTVSGNYIGGSAALCAGTPWTKTNRNTNKFNGIYFDASNATSSSIQGNTIQNFVWANSGAADWTGIHIANGIVNVGTVTGNTIGDDNSTGSVLVTNSGGAGASVIGIRHQSAVNGIIQNNTIGSITTASTTAFPTHFYGIYKSGGTGAVTISNNNIGSGANANSSSINASSAVAGNSQLVYGIFNAASANITITGNTIANMINANTNTSGITAGITFSGGTGTNTVSKNFIYNLNASNAIPSIFGIRITAGAGTYSNNIITLGNGLAFGCPVYGINEASTSASNIYFNTIYLGGTVTSGISPTYALYSGNTNTRDFRNNIFCNARSGGGTNYAIRLTGNTGLTIDYNDYWATPGNILGYNNGANQANLPAWRSSTGNQDVNSFNFNPGFSGAGGIVVSGYKPSVALNGITFGGITTDYNNVTRANPPTLGALESEAVTTASLSPQIVCTGSTLNVCFTSTGTFTSGNIYKAQLSDANGNFTSATNLSPNLATNASGPQQCISNIVIPSGLAAGSLYRIRVVSSAPVVTTDPGIQFQIKQSPKLKFDKIDVTCVNPTIGSINLTVTEGSGAYTGYLWTSDNGFDLTSQQNSLVLTGLTAGTYNVTVPDANGCSISGSATIIKTTIPTTPTLTATLPCVGTKPQFTAGNGSSYEFFLNSVSQGAPSDTNTYKPDFDLADGDKVCVRSLSAADCYSETCITIHAVAAPTANNITVCYDGNVHSASASATGADISYYAVASGGTSAFAPSETAVGTYTAWAEAVDPITSCVSASRTQVTLTIKDRPTIIPVSNAKYCNSTPGTILLSSFSPIGGTYDWLSSQDIGFGTSGTLSNIPFIANNGTNATLIADISATYTLNGCSSLPVIFHDTVFPTPIVDPISDLNYCDGDAAPTIHFSSPTAGSLSFNWTYAGDSGADSLVFTPLNVTTSPISQIVRVTAIDTKSGCSAGPAYTFSININPSPTDSIATDYCSFPNHIVLTALPAGQSSYLWNVGNTTSQISVDIAGNYGVTSRNSYGCPGSKFVNLGKELVIDGSFTNFKASSPSFFSNYIQSQGYYDGLDPATGLMTENRYAVNVSAWSDQPGYFLKPIVYMPPRNLGYNVYFHGRDHTNNTVGKRNFMMVNGYLNSDKIIWQQTVPVIYGRDYYFSAYACNLTGGVYARLQFQINGRNVGSILDLTPKPARTDDKDIKLSDWDRFFNTSLWTPKAGDTTATIRIVNLTTAKNGNDFGLDDISFGMLASIPNASSARANGGKTICVGNALAFTVDSLHGGTPPYAFAWLKPNGDTLAKTQNTSISNAQISNSGNYKLVVTDKNGCSVYAITHVNVTPFPVAPTAALVDRPAICTDDGGMINLSVPDGSGTILEWYAIDTVSGPIGTMTPLPISSPLITTTYYARWITDCDTSYFVPVTVTVGSQWTGANNNTNWNDVGNWSTGCGVPTAAKDANIPFTPMQPHINITGAACKNLVIYPSSSLTIESGKSLTISGNLTNNGTFTINSNALNHNGSLIVNGTTWGIVTYNRYLDNGRWFITSAPVTTTTDFSFSNSAKMDNGTDYDFAPYVEPDNEGWRYYNKTTSPFPTALTPGKGYLAKLKSPNTNIDFTGILNTDVLVQVTNTPIDNGWNAVGNPFTSAIGITINAGTTQNFLEVNKLILEDNYNAIYLWYQTGSYPPYDNQYYRVINNGGYLGKGYGGSISGEDFVQAGQGFLVNVKTTNGNITFTKNNTAGTQGMQINNPTATTMKSSKTSWPGITLLATNNGRTRSTIVAFNNNMTNGLDPSYDAGILSASDFNIYTHLVDGSNATDFMVQCLPDTWSDTLAVPIGIDFPAAGRLTFKAAGVILPEDLYPVIEDRLLQISIPLKSESDSLTVDLAEPTWGIGRFYLHIGKELNTVANNNPDEKITFTALYRNHKITIFGSPEQGSRAWLYDMSGRKLGGEYILTSANQNEIPAAGLASGIYLLRIEGQNGRQTIKITVLGQ